MFSNQISDFLRLFLNGYSQFRFLRYLCFYMETIMIAVFEIGTALVIIETEIKNKTRSIYSAFIYLCFHFYKFCFLP